MILEWAFCSGRFDKSPKGARVSIAKALGHAADQFDRWWRVENLVNKSLAKKQQLTGTVIRLGFDFGENMFASKSADRHRVGPEDANPRVRA